MTAPRDHAAPVVESYDVEEDQDVAVVDFDVLDENGKPRVLDRKCTTCVFWPGNLMQLRDGRLKDMIANAKTAGTWITCHKTLPYYPDNPGWQAICRGYYDAYAEQSRMLQWLIDRQGGISEVTLPAHLCQPEPGDQPDAQSDPS
jgi:hypothetical protein